MANEMSNTDVTVTCAGTRIDQPASTIFQHPARAVHRTCDSALSWLPQPICPA
jgi:hypothetical protein